jgi:N6-adenosine-specific RNA methylase IME4
MQLDADWDQFCALEDEIAGAETVGIGARWRYGRMLLRYESRPGDSNSPLAAAIRRLSTELDRSAVELYFRRQFAREYPDEDDLSNALERFPSWRELVKTLGKRRQPGITPGLPLGAYRCITIDPPWPIEKIQRDVRPAQERHLDYPILELDEIDNLVGAVVRRQNGCHVYLWTTHRFLPAAFELFDSWDVEYECLMTWTKNVGPTPFSWMYDTEHVLFGRRGPLELERKGLRLSFTAPAVGHSIKPDVFYERVREASPEPRLEMFTREPHEGFEPWGDEVAA